ncbi:MAG: methyl-accepting chemotaxis protein [bacterium]|nr:methyl-accepting chemotaxis protein [bacterium]
MENHESKNGSPLPIDILNQCKEVSYTLKDNSSALFKQLRTFFIGAAQELSDFQKLMKPYIEYYYPDQVTSDNPNFVRDVIIPSREEMERAIEKSAANMRGDQEINRNVVSAIQRALTLQESIDHILNIVEDIEIYFLNTMIISIKTGSQGVTLTQLSKEMGKLSKIISDISSDFRAVINKLSTECVSFDETREKVELIQRTYLTDIKITTRVVFDEIVDELNTVSLDVGNILVDLYEIQLLIKEVINKLQLEDLVRQNTEKVIYLVEDIIYNSDELYNKITNSSDDSIPPLDKQAFESALLCLAKTKIAEIMDSINTLNTDINKIFEMVREISKRVLHDLTMSDSPEQETDEEADRTLEEEADNLEAIYKQAQTMKNDFINVIHEIIKNKKNLFDFSQSILAIINRFDTFFSTISGVARKFEIINLLTRIELARNSLILKSVGGALAEISKLPILIKNNIAESTEQYNSVKEGIDEAINDYLTTFTEQESILDESVKNMETVSKNLEKSHKYYVNISQEMKERAEMSLQFIDTIQEEHSTLVNTGSLLEVTGQKLLDYYASLRANSDSTASGEEDTDDINNFTRELSAIKEYLLKKSADGDYRSQMLLSLIAEYVEETDKEEITFF